MLETALHDEAAVFHTRYALWSVALQYRMRIYPDVDSAKFMSLLSFHCPVYPKLSLQTPPALVQKCSGTHRNGTKKHSSHQGHETLVFSKCGGSFKTPNRSGSAAIV